jgi:hypothetical protein
MRQMGLTNMTTHKIKTLTIGMVLSITLSGLPARAELYIHGSLGQSRFFETNENGTWRQDGMPNQQFERQSLFYSGGIGYAVTRHWSVEGSYLNFGSAATSGTKVEDADYDTINARIIPGHECAERSAWSSRDFIQGGSLAVRYNYPLGMIYPFVRGGMWGAWHNHEVLDIRNDPRVHAVPHTRPHLFAGAIIGAQVGGGVCAGGSMRVCGQVDYYHALGVEGAPASQAIIVPQVGLEYHF